MMDYITIDVETANNDQGSICQLGIVYVKNNTLNAQNSVLINPNEVFIEPYHTDIHGITSEMVATKRIFPQIFRKLGELIRPFPILHHGHFDRIAINKACAKYDMPQFNFIWVNTQKLAADFLPELNGIGYKLEALCTHYNIDLNHHDALSDALAAQKIAEIIFKANNKTDSQWLEYFKKPPKKPISNYPKKLKPNQPGNVKGKYFGGHIVFTGALQTLDRFEAATAAQNLGFSTGDTLVQKTTMLCVSDEQAAKSTITRKIKMAKKLQAKGFSISIISEYDFMSMVKST